MNKSKILNKYINTFSSIISNSLNPLVKLNIEVFPISGPGAVIIFKFEQVKKAIVIHEKLASINDALKKTSLPAELNNLSNAKFLGTNYMLINNQAIIIKGDDSEKSWGVKAVKKDVSEVISTSQKARK